MKEKTIDKKIMSYGSVTLILSLIAIVLRTVCLFASYDAYIGYYKEGFFPSVLKAFLFISALYFVSAYFTVKDNVCCSNGRENNVALGIAGLVAAMAFSYSFGSAMADLHTDSVWYIMVFAVISILSAAYFMLKLFNPKSNTTHALMGFAVIIYCLFVVIVTYFDIFELLNGPNKIMTHLALLSVALFMLAEIRAYADKIKKGYYVATLCTATFFSGACSVPALIFHFASEFKNSYYVFHIVIAGVFVYMLVRLISFVIASVGSDGDGSEPIAEVICETQTSPTEEETE